MKDQYSDPNSQKKGQSCPNGEKKQSPENKKKGEPQARKDPESKF